MHRPIGKPAADGESPTRLEMREYRWLCPAFDFGEHGRERPVAECDVIERETVFPFFRGGVQGLIGLIHQIVVARPVSGIQRYAHTARYAAMRNGFTVL